MLKGKRGVEGCTTKGLEELVKTVGPEAHNDVVLRRNVAERGRDEGRERDLEKIMADLRKSVG
jgi:hypothetical protein